MGNPGLIRVVLDSLPESASSRPCLQASPSRPHTPRSPGETGNGALHAHRGHGSGRVADIGPRIWDRLPPHGRLLTHRPARRINRPHRYRPAVHGQRALLRASRLLPRLAQGTDATHSLSERILHDPQHSRSAKRIFG